MLVEKDIAHFETYWALDRYVPLCSLSLLMNELTNELLTNEPRMIGVGTDIND